MGRPHPARSWCWSVVASLSELDADDSIGPDESVPELRPDAGLRPVQRADDLVRALLGQLRGIEAPCPDPLAAAQVEEDRHRLRLRHRGRNAGLHGLLRL